MGTKAGVYAGTFDPITKGHLEIIFHAAAAMDKLYVVVGVNPSKNPIFTPDERIEMITKDINDTIKPRLAAAGFKCDIDVKKHAGLTTDFMQAHNAPFYIRGLRLGMEFDTEYPAVLASKNEYPEFIPLYTCVTDPSLHAVSSTLAREIARFGGRSLESYVTPDTAEKLRNRMAARNNPPKP